MTSKILSMRVILLVAMWAFYIGIHSVGAEKNCTCAYYEEHKNIGPFCDKWSIPRAPFCMLFGKENASACPGAVKWGSLYYTENKEVCNRSSRPDPLPWTLTLTMKHDPYHGAYHGGVSTKVVVTLCYLFLVMMIGTVGNALVVYHFAFRSSSDRPGSRFVVI